MFKEDYQKTFSQVTASEETLRRVLNLRKPVKTRTFRGTIGKVLMAAAILSTLVMTVSATELGWFRGYFEHSGAPLTQSEIDYIEENEQPLGQSQTRGGYTLRVKSAITDGRRAYIIIGVTGPEDAVLNRPDIPAYVISDGNSPREHLFKPKKRVSASGVMGLHSVEDYDGRDNTVDLILEAQLDPEEETLPFAPGSVWKIYIHDLVAMYRDDAYYESLKEKYGEDHKLTEEEWDRVVPHLTVAEGTWKFSITFEENNFGTVELIGEPITASVFGDGLDPITRERQTKEASITSLLLTPLSAQITADIDFTPHFDDLLAVMEDGRKIPLNVSGARRGRQSFTAERPIVLEEVKYIQLADGTEIPMPSTKVG